MGESCKNLDTKHLENPNYLNVDDLREFLDKYGVHYDQNELRPQLITRYVQLVKTKSPASVESWTGWKLNEPLPGSGKLTVHKLKIILALFSMPFSSQSSRADLVRTYNTIENQTLNAVNSTGATLEIIHPIENTTKSRCQPVPNNRSARSKKRKSIQATRKTRATKPSRLSTPPALSTSACARKRPADEEYDTIRPKSKRYKLISVVMVPRASGDFSRSPSSCCGTDHSSSTSMQPNKSLVPPEASQTSSCVEPHVETSPAISPSPSSSVKDEIRERFSADEDVVPVPSLSHSSGTNHSYNLRSSPSNAPSQRHPTRNNHAPQSNVSIPPPVAQSHKKRRIRDVSLESSEKGKRHRRNSRPATIARSRRSHRRGRLQLGRKKAISNAPSFIYQPPIEHAETSPIIAPSTDNASETSNADADVGPVPSLLHSSRLNHSYNLRSSPSINSPQRHPTRNTRLPQSDVSIPPPDAQSQKKRRIREVSLESSEKGKRRRRNSSAATTARPHRSRRGGRFQRARSVRSTDSNAPAFIYKPSIECRHSAAGHSQSAVDSSTRSASGQTSSYVQSLPTTPHSASTFPVASSVNSIPRNHHYNLRPSPSESSSHPPSHPAGNRSMLRPELSSLAASSLASSKRRRSTLPDADQQRNTKRCKTTKDSVRCSAIRPMRRKRRPQDLQTDSPLDSVSFVYKPPHSADSRAPPQIPSRAESSFAPSKRARSTSPDAHQQRKMKRRKRDHNAINCSTIRPMRRQRHSQDPQINPPLDCVSFVYHPPQNEPPHSADFHSIPCTGLQNVPPSNQHPPVVENCSSFRIIPSASPNPSSLSTNLPTIVCRPGIESWRTSVPATNCDMASSLCPQFSKFAPQVIEELKGISARLGNLQCRAEAEPSRRTTQAPLKDNTLAARIRVHVQTLFGKGFSAQAGRFPPAATHSERSHWKSKLDNLLDEDDEDLSSQSSCDLEEQDPSFPYAGGPGHTRASPQTLSIMWRAMRGARVSSFRPDFTKSMNHENNKLLWDLALALILKLSRAGEYDDLDLELYSEKQIYDALTAHVKYLTRTFREITRWSNVCRDTAKDRRRRVTRVTNRRRARVAYLLTQPTLVPLIPVAQKCTSDDETESEHSDDAGQNTSSKRATVLNLPWRHSRIKRMMIALDKLIALRPTSRPRGSNSGGKPPITRIRSRRAKSSTIKCPHGLPADCYEGEWLKDQNPSYATNLSIQTGQRLQPLVEVLENLL